jgi:rhamnopyranosyl-N-acetylglucosaminyl-diphospho-decaprenol beta-1,3/1,4-galactofuranosyltransferase
MSAKLAAVIVTFNRLDKLKLALKYTLSNPFYRIVIVNNCSTDGTREWLDSLSESNLVVLHNRINEGGAGGFHKGFQYVTEQLPEADWLVCFDDDAYPEGDLVGNFGALDIPPDVGSLAAAVYLPGGRISEMNRPSKNPFWHLRVFLESLKKGRYGFHIKDDVYRQNTPVEIDTSSFVGCFIRLSLIRDQLIGLPHKELFIYADDIIYVLQIRKAGFRHWFVPTIAFSHDCQTLVDQRDVYQPLWKAYYTYRNRIEMYRVASGIFYPFILVLKIPSFFFSVRHYKKGEQRKFLRITAKAVRDGMFRDYSMTHEHVLGLGK